MSALEVAGHGLAVTNSHRARTAYVYVRQSSVNQVVHHGESTDLQYGLVERAIHLGWPRDRVVVIDDDLGKSGGWSDQRVGFQRLMAEIGLGQVGLVVSLDASRLARNSSDWHRLLELCGLFDTLIADAERLYDPRAYHDRLLLGLSGIMSEAELHHLKLRLHAGSRNKALRGELRQPLPVGLARLASGEAGFNPDEEVQARLRLVFTTFAELGSATAVVRYLWQHHLPLPTRPLHGPAPHRIVWDNATLHAVLGILHNPAYAGAYVYGRTARDPARARSGRRGAGVMDVPMDRWAVLLHDAYPAYISWQTFMANQQRLEGNQYLYAKGRPGAPGRGDALLQGIAICARCGARMQLHYSGPSGEYPVYVCSHLGGEPERRECQFVRTHGIDAEIERLVLEALAPDQLAIALASMEATEHEEAALQKQWHLRLERARYESERARRQYEAVEPENRLVARTLERQWEEKLRAVEHIEREYETWRRRQQVTVSTDEREQILALAQDLPAIWQAPTTTATDRKQLVRLLIDSVLLDNRRRVGQTWFQINWRTGATTEHWSRRGVRSYADYADGKLIEERVRSLHGQRMLDAAIATTLNAEGFRTSHGQPFRGSAVYVLRKLWGLPTWNPLGRNPTCWSDGSYSVAAAAELLDVTPGTIWRWVRQGLVSAWQAGAGTPWHISLPEPEVERLRTRLRHTRSPRMKRSGRPAS
jgi:DNA invertase Pin-like site-specific DNA recombinase